MRKQKKNVEILKESDDESDKNIKGSDNDNNEENTIIYKKRGPRKKQ